MNAPTKTTQGVVAMQEPFYPSLEAYTDDVLKARDAYAADMRVQAGFCATGDGRSVFGKHRECAACRGAR